jgi:hypothetical protein
MSGKDRDIKNTIDRHPSWHHECTSEGCCSRERYIPLFVVASVIESGALITLLPVQNEPKYPDPIVKRVDGSHSFPDGPVTRGEGPKSR